MVTSLSVNDPFSLALLCHCVYKMHNYLFNYDSCYYFLVERRYHLSLLVHFLAKCKRDIQRLMVSHAILCECPKD